MSIEWGIFCDDSIDHTSDESVVAGFYSEEEASKYLKDMGEEGEGCYVHKCEEPEEDEEDEEPEED